MHDPAVKIIDNPSHNYENGKIGNVQLDREKAKKPMSAPTSPYA